MWVGLEAGGDGGAGDQRAAVHDDAILGAARDRIREGVAADGEDLGGGTGLQRGGRQPIARRPCAETASHASAGERCAAITSSAAVSSASERPTALNGSRTLSAPAATTAPASRSACTAVSPRGGFCWIPRDCRVEVGLRKRDDVDAAERDLAGHLALHLGGLHAERDAMASGGAGDSLTSLGHRSREVAEPQRTRGERLVDVQINGRTELGREGDELARRRRRIGIDVGRTADHIGAHGHRGAHHVAHRRASIAGRRRGDERHELQVGETPRCGVRRAPR